MRELVVVKYSRARPSRSNTAPPPSASSPSSSTAAVLLNQLNIPPQFREGLRVTDAGTMEVSIVLVCKVNKDLVSRINFAGATAVGLSGNDGRLLTALPSPNAAQLGFVGEVARVDPTVLQPLGDIGHILVIASVAADEFGQPSNIADTVAGDVARRWGRRS
ncbi:N-acetyl-l-glutamate kinase, putative [Theobroma cacao]|uniref:N-acetyl-l-glutamate kinase, putative n=1 Tax=Theobroma cacao TaxID=3641 RepID=A0A061G0N3_THECC|nr:N-acetyl-l-glutamate kinase, putative [Theobroma cacao]